MSIAKVEEALRKLATHLPAAVTGWKVEAGQDATGDPAIWVWVTLRDKGVDLATRDQVREQVRKAVHRASGSEDWVYIRFRGAWESVAT